MSRYTATGKTSAAASSGTNLFNLIGQSGVHVKLRQLRIGFEGASSPQQASFGLFRATARGTQSTTAAPLAEDSAAPASVTTVDTAWSVQPTLAANPLLRFSVDVLAEAPVSLELPDEVDTGTGTANGLCLQLLDNSLPGGVNATWTLIEEE